MSERRSGAGPIAFVDSSAIVTLVDAGDGSHAAAAEAYRGLVAAGYRFFTTDHVIAEAFDLLTVGIGAQGARRWLRDHQLAVYVVDAADLANAVQMIGRKALSEPLTLTDALSMVVMERLGVADAFAIDPGFLAQLG